MDITNEPKQVILVRKDLKMNAGKAGAQVAHASSSVILKKSPTIRIWKWTFKPLLYNRNSAFGIWADIRFKKICLAVNSELELINLYHLAKNEGLPCSLIKDAGLTVFTEPTYTTAAIGPAWPDQIDKLTKHLKLYR